MSSASPTIAPPSSRAITTLPPLPEWSLAPDIFRWCSRYIRQPDGPDAGGPWVFTTEQKRFLFYLYATDRAGRFIWNRAVFRRAKGAGKSPFMAAIALVELCGPVRVGGWKDGQPFGQSVTLPWVQLAGVSEKQTTNTMSMVLAMLNESPIIDEYGLDPGLTRVYTANGGRLEPITASAPTAEGARPSFCVLDETFLWQQANGGHKLAEVMRRNLGKSRDGSARSVETTNAHEQGMDSVAERSYEAWQAQVSGKSHGQTILYDSREAPPDTELADEASLMHGLREAYGDAHWIDLDRIRGEVYDPGTSPSESRRFYLNQLAVAEDAWLAPHEWDACAAPEKVVLPKEPITLGFDGSKSADNTVLMGCRVEDSHLFPLGVWDPEEHGGLVPGDEVDAAVEKAFADYDIVGAYCDLQFWETYISKWEQEHGNALCARASDRRPMEWDMRGHKLETTKAVEAYHDAIVEGDLTHSDDPRINQHHYNARRWPNNYGVTFRKESPFSARKVDGVAAAMLARKARQDYLVLPENKKRKKATTISIYIPGGE